MQSAMRSARSDLWLCSPSTQEMASTIFDLPQPFGPDDAGKPGAAESEMRLFAERFEAHQLDFAQFKQDFPFMVSAVDVTPGSSRSEHTSAETCSNSSRGGERDKICGGSFSSGPAAWRYDGGYGKTS